mgnify:FL=1
MSEIVTNFLHTLIPNAAAPTVSVAVSTATTLAAGGVTLHAATQTVLVSVEGAEVRMCPDGTTPTATLGHAVPVGRWLEISRAEANTAKWFSSGAAKLQVSQYTN